MNFSQLERAQPWDVIKWIENNIPELSVYQKQTISENEVGWWTDELVFFKHKNESKVHFLWRLTVIFFPVAWILLFIGLPLNMIFTGKWGYGKFVIEKFWTPWMDKLNLNL